MRTLLLSIGSVLINVLLAHSQDLIIKVNNDTVAAKVLEVGAEIRYKEFDFQNGPTYVILKSEVAVIQYENGKVDSLNKINTTDKKENVLSGTTTVDMFARGSKDATRYYKGYNGASTGTLITSLISPILGLIPAIACASSDPQMNRLNYPDKQLMNYRDYEYGYRDRAKKIKRSKVWTNWGIGLGVNVVLFILISSGN